ncbi:MAG TPA: T9SS type A sorting domain-containing protein [Ignavibacteriaceae bacterium]
MKIRNLHLLVLILFFTQIVLPQTTHDVSVGNFSFTPAQLTINVGDIVRWTNTGGLHNVVADDNSFTSGAVSSSAWVYEHTFNSAGTNPYYCSLHGGPGGVGMSGVVTVENATDVGDENISVLKFELDQNYPNPFNPSTNIQYAIASRQFVTLKVFDVLGNEVATLVNEYKNAGSYDFEFKASVGSRQLANGVYLYRLQAGNFVQTRKMILLK